LLRWRFRRKIHHFCKYNILTQKTPKVFAKKLENLASQHFATLKKHSEHNAQGREKWVIFKTFLGFSFLDIFKNVQFSKPN
jgi:hypothetical protein